MAVSVGGVRQPLTRRRERGVLSVLLAAHGAPVAAERLLVEVWGDEAPGQTLGSLQVAVSRLRTQLEPERAARKGSRLVSTAAGYSLVAEVDDVDVWRFESLAEQALASAHLAGAGWPRARRRSPSGRARRTPTATHPSCWPRPAGSRSCCLTVEEQRARALIDLGRPDDAQRVPGRAGSPTPLPRAAVVAARARAVPVRAAGRRPRDAAPASRSVSPKSSASTRRRRSSSSSRRCCARTPRSPRATAAPTTSPRPSSASPQAAAPVDTGTVGRQHVLDEAVALLEAARSTSSMRFLLVAGEPGIGKSRLVTDLGAHAAAAGLPGARRSLPRRRLRAGPVALARHRPRAGRSRPHGRARPAAGPAARWRARRAKPDGGGTGLRMFDAVVELVQSGCRRDSRCCWSSRTSTGPTPRRCSCSATWPGQDSVHRSS